MSESLFTQPSSVQFTLPDWLANWVAAYISSRGQLVTAEDKMALVLDAARQNILHKTGGPFAAAIFEQESGRLVSVGVNLVTREGLSILHAEMVAIALAQQKLGVYDLGHLQLPAHELVTSTEPCAMCFGALPWSGIKRLVTGAGDADARGIGFDEGPKLTQWQSALEERGIQVLTEVKRPEAAQVLKDYVAQGGHIYNSREDG